MPDLPVYQARFLNGKQMVISGNRRHFYFYDLDSNKLEKIPGIHGGVFAEKDAWSNLTKLFVPNQ